MNDNLAWVPTTGCGPGNTLTEELLGFSGILHSDKGGPNTDMQQCFPILQAVVR